MPGIPWNFRGAASGCHSQVLYRMRRVRNPKRGKEPVVTVQLVCSRRWRKGTIRKLIRMVYPKGSVHGQRVNVRTRASPLRIKPVCTLIGYSLANLVRIAKRTSEICRRLCRPSLSLARIGHGASCLASASINVSLSCAFLVRGSQRDFLHFKAESCYY